MNWYRASFAEEPRSYIRDTRVQPPTLGLALEKNPIVPQEPARRSGAFCADASIVELTGASHWVLHEQRKAASALLLDFFGAARGGAEEPAP